MRLVGAIAACVLTAAVGLRFDPHAPVIFIFAVEMSAGVLGWCLGAAGEK